MTGTYRLGGSTINFKEDPKFQDLLNKIEHRKNLLKSAIDSDIEFYDEEGDQVPRVSRTPRKSAIAISF